MFRLLRYNLNTMKLSQPYPSGLGLTNGSWAHRRHRPLLLSLYLHPNIIFLFRSPTPLDALLFAYIHVALNPRVKGQERARSEVNHRVNLVAWERKVRSIVQGAFQPQNREN